MVQHLRKRKKGGDGSTGAKSPGRQGSLHQNGGGSSRSFKESRIRRKSGTPIPWIIILPWTGMFFALGFFMLGVLTPLLVRTVDYDQRSSSSSNSIDHQRGRGGGSPSEQVAIGIEEPSEQISDLDKNRPYSCSDDDEDLQQFLHDDPQPGLHVICVSENSQGQLSLRFFKQAWMQQEVIPSVDGLLSPVPWSNLKMILKSKLKLPSTTPTSPPEKPSWVIYSGRGEHIVSEHEKEADAGHISHIMSNRYGIVLVYEGGTFRWPGVRIGFVRQVGLNSIMPAGTSGPEVARYRNRTVSVETVSLSPLVLSVDGFLSESECDHIQSIAAPNVQPADVPTDQASTVESLAAKVAPVPTGHDKMLTEIDHRFASLVRIHRNRGQQLQVLRYDVGEKFDSKWNNQQMVQNNGNRMVTIFTYLNNVEGGGGVNVLSGSQEGGEEDEEEDSDEDDCDDDDNGLWISPKIGRVILSYSMTADGKIDPPARYVWELLSIV